MGMAIDLPYPEIVLSLLVVVGAPFLYYLLWQCLLFPLWWRPRRTRLLLEAQGINCLPHRFLGHNNFHEFVAINAHARSKPMPEIAHNIAPRMLPHLFQWSKTYGKPFVYWFGSQARFILTDPDQAKEVLSNKFGNFKKFVSSRPERKEVGGMGLASLEGEKWAQHRRIVSPAFFHEKLKAMAPTMVACADALMKTWELRVEQKEVIDVFQEFRVLTADIIAHTGFGSSFAEGKLVFELQHKQRALISKLEKSIYIPGSIYLPSARNQYRKELKRKIAKTLARVIESRLESCKTSGDVETYGDDLLGLMLAANRGELHGNQRNLSMGLDELIDECKTFFLAGHETTSTLLTFMFLLLGSSPEWQERLREEVYEVGMVINETLRLYPPGLVLSRVANTDIKLGTLTIPAKTVIEVPVITWHHDEQYWGPDANEFRPERFEGGISNACKVIGAYLPFSIGPRHCVGHTFATMEAKLVLSTILQRYRFRISPKYVHAPTITLTLQPQFGMPIIFERLF